MLYRAVIAYGTGRQQVPFAAQHEGLQYSKLRSLSSFIYQHIFKCIFQAAEDAAPCAGQRGEHHLRLLHKGQLQVL